MKNKPEKKKLTGCKEEVFNADDLNKASNESYSEWEEFILQRLTAIMAMLPPREGQKQSVFALIKNWKDHIKAMEKLIEEIKDGEK